MISLKTFIKFSCLFVLGFLIETSLFTPACQAQVPSGLNFQTIIRDQTGKPLSNRNVNIKFTILQGGVNGTSVYSEEHRSLANEFGLVNLLIGYGFPLQGRFDQIKWEDGNMFLKTEIDPNGGFNYELSSVSPFLSVPYALYSAQTKLEAGPGIQIQGSRISNTGDPDPNDDLKSGSSVAGDLNGTLPAPKVAGLQGRPVQDINPAMGQALIWNGSQWVPAQVDADPNDDLKSGSSVAGDLNGTLPAPKVAGLQGRPVQDINPAMGQALIWNGNQWVPTLVDLDPSNDLLLNSPAGGDLTGNFPNPKVSKLNGIPLATSQPDSGDVLTYVQGEWKHLPAGSAPGNSLWKKSGSEIVLDNPIGVNSVNTQSAEIITQSHLHATMGTDSAQVSPLGLQMRHIADGSVLKTKLLSESFTIDAGNTNLFGLYSYGGMSPGAFMEFWNADTSSQFVYNYLNASELIFNMKAPYRASFMYGNLIELVRQTKTTSPAEYGGVEIYDSLIVLYNGNRDHASLRNAKQWGGGFHLYDNAGKERVNITSLVNDQTQPYFSLSSTKTNREVAEILSSSSTGELILYNTNNNQFNFYAGYSTYGPTFPYMGIGDGAGGESAGMYMNTSGQGVVFGDIKSFRMQDPQVENQEIWYACVEGPEAAAYERGSSRLINGEAFVRYSDHFTKVINPQSVTVQLTPGFADTYGLAVVEKRADGFLVRELKNGQGNFTFDWEVKGVRNGFENYQVYHKKEALRANSESRQKGIKEDHPQVNELRQNRHQKLNK